MCTNKDRKDQPDEEEFEDLFEKYLRERESDSKNVLFYKTEIVPNQETKKNKKKTFFLIFLVILVVSLIFFFKQFL